MKRFEIELFEVELVHYSTIYHVNADSEEEAKKLVLRGDIESTDSITYDHSHLNKEIAQEYADGTRKLWEFNYCNQIPTQEEMNEIVKQKKIAELQKEIENLKNA